MSHTQRLQKSMFVDCIVGNEVVGLYSDSTYIFGVPSATANSWPDKLISCRKHLKWAEFVNMGLTRSITFQYKCYKLSSWCVPPQLDQRRGVVERPCRSPDLTPLDFFCGVITKQKFVLFVNFLLFLSVKSFR